MTNDQEHDQLQAQLEAAAELLGEHFESVLILATNSGGNGATRHGVLYTAASGSTFANVGAAQAYVNKKRGYDEAAGFDDYHGDQDDEDD